RRAVFSCSLVSVVSARGHNDRNSRRAGVKILLYDLQKRVRVGWIVLTEFPDHRAAILRTELRQFGDGGFSLVIHHGAVAKGAAADGIDGPGIWISGEDRAVIMESDSERELFLGNVLAVEPPCHVGNTAIVAAVDHDIDNVELLQNQVLNARLDVLRNSGGN